MPLRSRMVEASREEGEAPASALEKIQNTCQAIGGRITLGLALLLQAPDAPAQQAVPPREQVVLSNTDSPAKGKQEKSLLPPRAERDPRLARLIKELGHDDFRIREKASAALPPIIDLRNFWQLREALADDDAEVVTRSKIIWEDLYARERKVLDPYFREVVRKSRPRHFVESTWEHGWTEFRGLMEEWKFKTLTETPRWIAHVSWMKQQKIYKKGLEDEDLLHGSFSHGMLPNEKEWVRKHHKTYPDLDAELRRLAGVYVTEAVP